MASRLWKFLTTDIGDLVSFDTVDSGKDAADAVLGLADVLQTEGPNVQQIAPLVIQLNSLLDVLNSPLGKIVEGSLPFVSIAMGLLKFYLEKTKEEPTVAQSVALLSQAAYLESFKQLVESQPKLQQWIATKDQAPAAKVAAPQIKLLGEYTLTDKAARTALLHFHESELAVAFNGALSARLMQLGLSNEIATKISEAVAKNTNRQMQEAVAQAGDTVTRLLEWYHVGGDAMFEKYLSIDTYLEEWIAPRPHEQVFAEPFAFKDIYVPLKAKLTGVGEKPVIIEQWVRQMLCNDDKKDQVLFVQGGPGRGKSVFCRMFADWVRRHEHPRWTPILIRLRDVAMLSRDFEETLAKAVDRDFAKTDSGWLTDRNINFLFILDGFDELLMEGRTSGGLDAFLEQVGRFQEQCARNSEKHHRVLITGRTLALQKIESRMPNNLARIEIEPMDDELQSQWFDRWGHLLQPNEHNLQAILIDQRFPERMRKLAREPLLLYLLAAMYRDGELRLDMFADAEGAKAKVLIYERTLNWVLTKQRAKGHRRANQTLAVTRDTVAQDLNPDITELAPEHLRRILQEAGLCVVQSGMEFASIRTIEERLTQDSAAKTFLEAAQKQLETDDTPLRNALAAFYLQEGRQGEGSIEFVHKSFGEFLCAERIVNALIDICQPGSRNREYDIDDPAFYWLMYDLLGCHVLTHEIVEYITVSLIKKTEFQAELLHKRIYEFYWHCSEGNFIDAPPENLPQKKMRLLKERLLNSKSYLGQRQLDVYAGLNTMILLWELHRYSHTLYSQENPKDTEEHSYKLRFHPCINPFDKSIDIYRFQRIVNVSYCLYPGVFNAHCKSFLRSIDLSGADLKGIDFSGANLSEANLSGANLSGANLSGANLSGANLSNAYFTSTDLRHANLRHSNLCMSGLNRADLRGADLSSANCIYADFSDADLRIANLRFTKMEYAYLEGTKLCKADISNSNLNNAYLTNADLRGSNLQGAKLQGATLYCANLCDSYLHNADFHRANLRCSNLRGADPILAKLNYANLSGANLGDVYLYGANLSAVRLDGAIFSDEFGTVHWNADTNWERSTGLESAIGVPEALKQQLGLS